MQPVLQIAELIQMPTFGINKVRKIALENIAQSVVLSYAIIRGGRTLRVQVARPHPADESKPLTQFVELNIDAGVEGLKEFINKVEDGHYLAHGFIKSDEFKEDFLPFYIDKLTAKLSYGTSPVVQRISQGRGNTATIYFETTKNGEVINHSARWTILDFDANNPYVVVIPRKAFKTYREFITILANLLGTDKERFILTEDPEEAKGETIKVAIHPNDLVYTGTFEVHIPHLGDEPKLYSKTSNAVVPPVTEEPEGETGETGNTGGTGDTGTEGETVVNHIVSHEFVAGAVNVVTTGVADGTVVTATRDEVDYTGVVSNNAATIEIADLANGDILLLSVSGSQEELLVDGL